MVGALNLDGSDDQVAIADASDLRISGDITIAFWTKKNAEATLASRLVGKANASVRNYVIWEEQGAGKRLLAHSTSFGIDESAPEPKSPPGGAHTQSRKGPERCQKGRKVSRCQSHLSKLADAGRAKSKRLAMPRRLRPKLAGPELFERAILPIDSTLSVREF